MAFGAPDVILRVLIEIRIKSYLFKWDTGSKTYTYDKNCWIQTIIEGHQRNARDEMGG